VGYNRASGRGGSFESAELGRWGIAVEPENPKNIDDLDEVLAVLAKGG
jgi:hypothetical protein